MRTDRELLELALKLVAKYHARKTVLVDWEKSVIEAIQLRLAEDDEAKKIMLANRFTRIKQKIEGKAE